MYAFESTGSRKGLHAMVIGAFAVAVVMFSLSGYEGMPFPLIFQTVAIICLVLAVYLTTRYSLRLYRYAIEPNGIIDAGGIEQHDLVITDIVGKRMRVVVRVALRDIERVTVIRRADRKSYQAVRASYGKEYKIFCYANTPAMAEECHIIMNMEKAVVIMPVDKRMVSILQARAASNHMEYQL